MNIILMTYDDAQLIRDYFGGRRITQFDDKINSILQQPKFIMSDVIALRGHLLIFALLLQNKIELIGGRASFSFDPCVGSYHEKENRAAIMESMKNLFNKLCYLAHKLEKLNITVIEIKETFAPLETKNFSYINPHLIREFEEKVTEMSHTYPELFSRQHIECSLSELEARRLACIVAQGARQEESLFGKLPDEINVQIIAHASNIPGTQQSFSSLEKTAFRFFDKPTPQVPLSTVSSCIIM